MNLAAALQELIDCSVGESSRVDIKDEEAGSALLETIRHLARLSPEERTALIRLLTTFR